MFAAAIAVGETPSPRVARYDSIGNLLPTGQVARIGVVPSLSSNVLGLAWSDDCKWFSAFTSDQIDRFDATRGVAIDSTRLIDPLSARLTYLLFRNNDASFLRLSGADYSLVDSYTGSVIVEGKLPPALVAENRPPRSISMSADHRFVAGVHAERDQPGVVWLLDLAHQRTQRIINDRADIRSVRLAPDGKTAYYIAGNDPPFLHARDLARARDRWSVELLRIASPRTISPKGDRLVLSDGAKLRVYDTSNGNEVLDVGYSPGSLVGQRPVDISPDSKWMAVIDGQEVHVWDIAEKKLVHRLPHSARILAFAPDGSRLLTANDWPQVWSIPKFESQLPIPSLQDRSLVPQAMEWSRSGDQLLVGWSSDTAKQKASFHLQVVDVERMSSAFIAEGGGVVQSVRLSPDGKSVQAILHGNDHVHEWSVARPEASRLLPVPTQPGTGLPWDRQLTADGKVVEIRSASPVAMGTIQRPQPERFDVASNDRRHVAVRLIGVGTESLREVKVPYLGNAHPGISRAPTAMVTHWNGQRFDAVRMRTMPTLSTMEGRMALGSAPVGHDDTLLVSSVDAGYGRRTSTNEAYVWDSTTGDLICPIDVALPVRGQFATSPNGRWVAYASPDGTIMVDISNRGKRSTDWPEAQHAKPATNASFDPEGRRLAITYADGTIGVWHVPAHNRQPWLPSSADQLWDDLACGQIDKEWQAMWYMLDHPRESAELLSRRMRPVPAIRDLSDLLAKLNHERYRQREDAQLALMKYGDAIEGELHQALASPASPEQSDRVERLLKLIDPTLAPSGDIRRALRGIWVLQRLRNEPIAKATLKQMATGAAGSRITIAAKRAIDGPSR